MFPLTGLTGKLKQLKVKNPKGSTKEEQQDEKGGAVDQIKKKYGFSLSGVSHHLAKAFSIIFTNIEFVIYLGCFKTDSI